MTSKKLFWTETSYSTTDRVFEIAQVLQLLPVLAKAIEIKVSLEDRCVPLLALIRAHVTYDFGVQQQMSYQEQRILFVVALFYECAGPRRSDFRDPDVNFYARAMMLLQRDSPTPFFSAEDDAKVRKYLSLLGNHRYQKKSETYEEVNLLKDSFEMVHYVAGPTFTQAVLEDAWLRVANNRDPLYAPAVSAYFSKRALGQVWHTRPARIKALVMDWPLVSRHLAVQAAVVKGFPKLHVPQVISDKEKAEA